MTTLTPNSVTNGTTALTTTPPLSAMNFATLNRNAAYSAAVKITLKKYYGILPLSLIFNMFCLAVLGKRMLKSTAYFYMGNIAIWDALTICSKAIIMFMFDGAWVVGDGGCMAINFLAGICPLMAVWLVVLLTADRFIAVWLPFRHREICTMKRAIIAYIVLLVVMCGTNVNYFWQLHGIAYTPYYYCMYIEEYERQAKAFVWVFVTLLSFAPTIIMFVLNIGLAMRVRQQMASLGDAKSTSGKGKMSTEAHVTIMAFTISISFLLLTGPYCGFTIATYVWNYRTDNQTYITYALTQAIVFLLVDINHCINVFLYFFSGRRFRQDAMVLLTCGRRRQKKGATGVSKTGMTTGTSVGSVSASVSQ